jgi:Protein of unknown function (DUF3631)
MLVNREIITSAEVVRQLNADKDGEWCEFRGRGPITQRQVAALLEQYDIFSATVHPTKRPTESPRGYKCAELRAVIARLLPHDPHTRTPAHPSRDGWRKCADVQMQMGPQARVLGRRSNTSITLRSTHQTASITG